MSINISRLLGKDKTSLLKYFRDRAQESLQEVRHIYADSQFRERANAVNGLVIDTRENLIKAVVQKATKENWVQKDILECVLMITYASYVVMIESRNEVWPYEYMTFSRRIGEIWDPFCRLCFDYPVKDIELFVPPLFSEVRKKWTNEIAEFIEKLGISERDKRELKKYYNKVWSLVTSGEIKLELDLHFKYGKQKVVVDFKSGFSSNEKGNTNRLLLVASIYKNLEENYRTLLFVRSSEDENNHYLQTLKKSGIWEVYCGEKAYLKMQEYSGFGIKQWVATNVDWKGDFKASTMKYFKEQRIDQYLRW